MLSLAAFGVYITIFIVFPKTCLDLPRNSPQHLDSVRLVVLISRKGMPIVTSDFSIRLYAQEILSLG